jgi:hypothetical protein
MKSSEKLADPQHSNGRLHILSGGGTAPYTPALVDDPYRVLDDLMAVVEALCPVWPPREIDGPMNDLRL